jgi:hypothetical protein
MQDDKLSIAPCSEFINLVVVEKVQGGVRKTPVSVESILTSDCQFVLVEGLPGMGKSTLCWELCWKWGTLKCLKDYNIVLLLKLREKRIQNATKLADIFYHQQKELSQSIEAEVYECEGEGLLLILDGFDEMPISIAQDRDSFIMELISGVCLPRASRLVTSRPSSLHYKDDYVPSQHRHVEVVGFTDECKIKYAEIVFAEEHETLAHFKTFIFSNPIINSLMQTPVNCAIVAQIYKEIRSDKRLIKTMTKLYTTLVLVLIKRHMIEAGKCDKWYQLPEAIKDLSGDVLTAFRKVAELAYQGLFKPAGVQLVFSDSDVGDHFQHLGLLNATKELYVCEGARTSYSFPHLSIQEFLAAWHVSQHPELMDKALSKSMHGLQGKNGTFGPFFCGMVPNGCSRLQINSFNGHLIRCFYEGQDCCSKLWHLSARQFDLCLYNSLEMYAFGYVLVHAPIQWHLVVADTSFNILISSLSNHMGSSGVRGSIIVLRMDSVIPPYYSPNIGVLPQYLLQHVIELRFQYTSNISIALLSKGIPALTNLQTISLKNRGYQICKDDYLLYRSLRSCASLQRLEIIFVYISDQGIAELSNTLAGSSKLSLVRLIYSRYEHYSQIFREILNGGYHEFSYEYKIHMLVDAALSCSSLQSLATNIPFDTRNEVRAPLEHLLFLSTPIHYHHYAVPITTCLVRIADICKLSSMKTLWVAYNGYRECLFLPRQRYCDFLTVLNNSLHLNMSMHAVRVDSRVLTLFNRDILFEALSQNPQKMRQKSNSLPHLNVQTKYGIGLARGLSRTISCPALHTLNYLHPLLDRAFRCHKLYHTENCDHRIFSGVHPGLLIF